jgi:hypothetical protein
MTPQEKDLIQNVFDRLQRSGVGQKDPEAEALILDGMRRIPNAAYGLVQAVIVQEMGLNQATAKIAELQRQLDEARTQTPAAPSGSFLGAASPWGGGSVPRSGPASAPPPPQYASPQYAPPQYAPPPQQAYAPPPQAAASPWSQPTAGGGFLRNAATMAAGVAGGTLIAEGLSGLFGGHHGGGFGGGFAGGSPWGGAGNGVENVTVNNYYGDRDGRAEDADYRGDDRQQDNAGYQDDAGYQDVSDDSSFDSGGFDDTTDI